MPVARQRQAPDSGVPPARALDQFVVLDEAQEHAAQQPVHARLRDDLVSPALEVSAVRSASRAACHSACRPAFSSATSAMRWRRSSSRRLSRRVRSASSCGALIAELFFPLWRSAGGVGLGGDARRCLFLHPGLRQRQRAGVLDVVHDRHRDAIDDRQALVRRGQQQPHAGRVAGTAGCSSTSVISVIRS